MNRKDEKKPWHFPPFEKYMSSFKKITKDGELRKAWGRSILEGTVFALGGFLFSSGEMLFGTFPMGVAFLCASTKDLWYIWAGGLVASFTRGNAGILFAAIYSVALALRLRLSAFYREQNRLSGTNAPIGIRVAIATVLSFSLGLYGCVSEGFTVHALMAMLFYMLSAGAFTFLYAGAFMGVSAHPLYKKGAYAAILFSLIYSVKGFSFLAFSPAVALSALLCFFMCEKGDLLYSVALGVILGIACGREYVPILALLSLVSGALYKYSKRTAPWLGVLAGFAWSFYARGSSSFLYVLPDLVCGLLVYIPISTFFLKNKRESAEKTADNEKKSDENLSKNPMENSLDVLSERLFALSGKLRLPAREDAGRICETGLNRVCGNCKGGCFKEEDRKKRLADTLFEVGKLSVESPPSRLSSACTKWETICDNVNNDYAAYLRHLYEADRSDCYARCYKSISELLHDRETLHKQEQAQNEKVQKDFERALHSLSIGFESCFVKGERSIVLRASGVSVSDLGKSAPELQKQFEQKCGLALSYPELECTPQRNELIFKRREKISAKFGAAAKRKEGEEYCGDTVYTFIQDHCFYALLCDGMGSGRDAALVSRIACHFVEQLSLCGGALPTVLKTVNDFLLCQSCECCTTVDLMRLDLYDGKCDFVKCGACPSLVLRGGNTFKLSSASMPVGAAREVNCELITLHLKPGDKILLMSDGVCTDMEGSSWLSSLLSGKLRENVQEMAEDILAIAEKDEQKPDDRSVAVVEVCSVG